MKRYRYKTISDKYMNNQEKSRKYIAIIMKNLSQKKYVKYWILMINNLHQISINIIKNIIPFSNSCSLNTNLILNYCYHNLIILLLILIQKCGEIATNLLKKICKIYGPISNWKEDQPTISNDQSYLIYHYQWFSIYFYLFYLLFYI
jgi:ATP-dependent phosphoenolpyruvate carboxykinase